MVSWHRNLSRMGLLALLGACAEDAPPPRFAVVENAEPVPVAVIRDTINITPEGYRIPEVHVLMPVTTTAAAARVTLQQVIDSVADADTLAAGIRAVGFLMGDYDAVSGTAELEPVMSAFWHPTDSVGMTGRNRTARFLTDYRLFKPFPADQPDTTRS